VREYVVDRREPGGIVADRDNLPQAKTLDDRFKIANPGTLPLDQNAAVTGLRCPFVVRRPSPLEL
jgi:hypothetical protein